MRGGDRDDGGEMRREFLGRCPLIEAGVGTAPHRDLAVAERLLRQPLDDVVTIARLLRERFEFAGGISATAHIDQRKGVTVRREVCGARVIAVRDVGRECENDRRLRRRAVRRFRQIKRGVELDLVAHRNLYAPAQIVIGRGRRRFFWRRRRRWRRRLRETLVTTTTSSARQSNVFISWRFKRSEAYETRRSFLLVSPRVSKPRSCALLFDLLVSY